MITISQVVFDKPPVKGFSFILVSSIKNDLDVVDKARTFYNIFIDDSLFVAIAPIIKFVMVARIEVLYMVLNLPNLASR